MPEMEKTYDPKREPEIYKKWEESGFFNPDNAIKKSHKGKQKTFSMMLPPPNVTGILHVGHALEDTLQDILVRYHRMKGDATLWVRVPTTQQLRHRKKLKRRYIKKRENPGTIWDGKNF
jgi:Valyl-tRNA synthetase